MTVRNRELLIAVSLCAMLAVTPVRAQTVDDAGKDNSGISEIVVTAQRKEENSQKAGIPLSVISADALADVTSVENASQLAPSLQLGRVGGDNPILYVRGIGSFVVTGYTDPAVAVNYDGVYIGRPASVTGMFYDISRVEVLKGPQGTLYGRNATGGAINVIPNSPKLGDFSVAGTLSYGNYGSVNAQGAVNVPVSDTVALRAAGIVYSRDGYNTDGTDSESGKGGRLQLLFEPSVGTSFRLSGDYFHLGGEANAGVQSAVSIPGMGFVPINLGTSAGPYDPRSVAVFNSALFPFNGAAYGTNFTSTRPYSDSEFYGLTGEANTDLGFGKLAFVGAWRRADVDNNTIPNSLSFHKKEKAEQYSAELRLSGSAGSLDWLVGGYYFKEQVDFNYAGNMNYFASLQAGTMDSKSYAGFGRLTWNLTDRLRLIGALRYTKDEKSFAGTNTTVFPLCLSWLSGGSACSGQRALPTTYGGEALSASSISSALASIGYVQTALPDPTYYDTTAAPGGGAYLVLPITVGKKISPDKVTYRLAAEFEPRDGSLLYTSFETGYRSGSFSFSNRNPVSGPEEIEAYTIGAKNRFFDNRLQVNVELFLWKYRNQMLAHVINDPVEGQVLITENVGRSTSKGFEIEVVGKPAENTLLSAGIQYLDAKYDSFIFTAYDQSVNCPTTNNGGGKYTVNCSNLQALRSPNWTENLGIQQTFPLVNGLELRAEASTHYQSSNFIQFERQLGAVQGAYWMSDAALTLGSADEKWSLSAFVNNIENKRRATNSYYNAFSGLISTNFGPPRIYGLRVGFHF